MAEVVFIVSSGHEQTGVGQDAAGPGQGTRAGMLPPHPSASLAGRQGTQVLDEAHAPRKRRPCEERRGEA
eukprot:11787770-Alexandrium_andersonii.AAC.1